MDVQDYEGDVVLQKASSELLADFESSLTPFLWRILANGKTRIRQRVRVTEAVRLGSLLEPFQELPQLLDPHLGKLLPVLADALLEYLRSDPASKTKENPSHLLMPLSKAICRLLYAFCKIRGDKIVVRFFSAETKNLELLLSAIEADANAPPLVEGESGSASQAWSWEERYVGLLWLSHLLLAPFDLATISSAGTASLEPAQIKGLVWPENLPGVTLRVVPLGIRYLASAGKERDAAKTLLVRICMRKDMQELGMLDVLVRWALSCLEASEVEVSPYYYIGILSFLAGVLISSESTADMDPYLMHIFQTVQNTNDKDLAAFQLIYSSALARKTVIKVLRTVSVLVLRGKTTTSPHRAAEATEIVEATIGHLLEALSDNDTPVRLAASKALSVVTLKLAPVMASQVVEAVLDSLNHNVLWSDKLIGQKLVKVRDLSAVNPLEWHGLILTLSHLLYRRSPPTDTLADILHALLIGLTFELRSTSGSSVGTNVRDAACFGIWALARRYTTAELQSVSTSSVLSAKHHDASSSIIQVLATELVVSASLDSAGNIRRGASAALQELIGRHPDVVAQGIPVVQVVDYHAVALRSRGILEVAPKAAQLSMFYEEALIDGLLDWRGIGDGSATSRRNAATGIGLLATEWTNSGSVQWDKFLGLILRVEQQLNGLKPREIDQRHGLLLSLAAIIGALQSSIGKEPALEAVDGVPGLKKVIHEILRIVLSTLEDAKTSKYRRADLIAEAVSRLIFSACPILRLELIIRAIKDNPALFEGNAALFQTIGHTSLTGTDDFGPAIQSFANTKMAYDASFRPNTKIVDLADELLTLWLCRGEKDVISAAVEAAADLFLVVDPAVRDGMVKRWISKVTDLSGGRSNPLLGHLLVLDTVFPVLESPQQDLVCKSFLERWQTSTDIENKISLLQCVYRGTILWRHASLFINMISAGLDDYTTDARGDIGSLVRVEAIKAAGKTLRNVILLLQSPADNRISEISKDQSATLFGKLLRLAAEKLDKVRTEAQQALVPFGRKTKQPRFDALLVSSYAYFSALLDRVEFDITNLNAVGYLDKNQWYSDLLEGYVTSADMGSEGLIKASRSALVYFCERESNTDAMEVGIETASNRHIICETLLDIAKANLANDRVLVPTMEVLSFLFDTAILQQSNISFKSLYLLTQKTHFKTSNVRKLEASIKLYGGLLEVYPEALTKLTSMLLHPYPNVRNAVADMVFVTKGVGGGVNWTKAKKGDLEKLRGELEIRS